jgi:hypothetical protein
MMRFVKVVPKRDTLISVIARSAVLGFENRRDEAIHLDAEKDWIASRGITSACRRYDAGSQ